MRDKFSELIDKGVASFNYVPLTGEMPEQDPVCRAYNNIFSIPTDTHMSCLEDGRRVITGHMIKTDDWNKFINSTCWGAVCFISTGFWCLSCFLNKYDLVGSKGELNGDVVYFIEPIKDIDIKMSKIPVNVTTTESNIPQPITTLTTTGNMMHIQECFETFDMKNIVKRLNESSYIKGSNWVPSENSIVGLVGDVIYVIK